MKFKHAQEKINSNHILLRGEKNILKFSPLKYIQAIEKVNDQQLYL